MLIRQAGINLAANVISALLGLLSVSIFTRLFSPQEYGTYLLGAGFATVVSVFLVGWFRNLILSGHARNDGTDVRGLRTFGIFAVLPGRSCRLRRRLVARTWTAPPRSPRSCSPLPSACSN